MRHAITIDGQTLEVPPGTTILEAARQLNIDIPTLCHADGCTPATSCLACLVKVTPSGRWVPSCATKVTDGMQVESETEEVREARRTSLELLLSDHVGDCLSPCHRICPLRLPIPAMIRQVEQGELKAAIGTARQHLAMPAILGRLCHHPCENGCRRTTWDNAVAIQELERYVGETDLFSEDPYLPPQAAPSGRRIAIIGTGPSGLTAAYHLLVAGHACRLYTGHSTAGGSLRAEVEKGTLEARVLEGEIRQLTRLGAEIVTSTRIETSEQASAMANEHDAILIAAGSDGARPLAELFKLETTATGIKTDPLLFRTTRAEVFAAGSAVRPVKPIVRAMSEGQSAAHAIDLHFRGTVPTKEKKPFSSMMGRLEEGEAEVFLQLSSAKPRVPQINNGLETDEAVREAQRCFHCDCRAAGQCGLQHYGARYGAEPNEFSRQRRCFEQQLQPGNVIYEPGKCILCGLCVQVTERAAEPLGLTFVGRGFNVRIAAPLNYDLDAGLRKAAAECVEICPTGALVFNERAACPFAVG